MGSFTPPPEIARRWDSECTGTRLALGLGTATVLGGCLYGASLLAPAQQNPELFTPLIFLQAVILVGYGTSRVIASIGDEKKSGTWDLQRLTPLTSWQLAAGKFLGAPLYAVCLAAALFPWSLLALASSPKLAFADAGKIYALLFAATCFAWALGLAISAHADERHGVGDGSKVLLIMALYPLLFSTLERSRGPGHADDFYGLAIPTWLFASGSLLVFGAWIFESARLRIAFDKLEPAHSWRLPAFCAFLMWYQLGFDPRSPALTTILPLVIVLISAIGETWGAQEWRAWAARGAVERIARAPAWMTGLTACALLTFVAVARGLRVDSTDAATASRFPVLLLAFTIRDVLFLQWCRLKIRRRPEIVALVYIGLAYGLPFLITMILRNLNAGYLYCASVEKDLPALVNFLPGIAQAAAAAALLAVAAAKVLDRPA